MRLPSFNKVTIVVYSVLISLAGMLLVKLPQIVLGLGLQISFVLLHRLVVVVAVLLHVVGGFGFEVRRLARALLLDLQLLHALRELLLHLLHDPRKHLDLDCLVLLLLLVRLLVFLLENKHLVLVRDH